LDRTHVGFHCVVTAVEKEHHLRAKRLPTMNSSTTLMTSHSSTIFEQSYNNPSPQNPEQNRTFVCNSSRVRSFSSCSVLVAFSVATRFTVSTGNRVTSKRNAIGHTHVRFKRTCVGSNGILECKFLSENAHRTSRCEAFVSASSRFSTVTSASALACFSVNSTRTTSATLSRSCAGIRLGLGD
jgi:hypothetical protein